MERRAQHIAFSPRNGHPCIIDQRGLMQRYMGAVGELHRHRRVRIADRRQRRFIVEIFLSIP